MFGVIAAVVARRVDHGLSGWDEFGIVVGGTLASTVLIAAAQWTWKKHHAPQLVIECGNGSYDFERPMGHLTPLVQRAAGGDIIDGAYTKLLRVRETRGKSRAREVVARLTNVVPPPPAFDGDASHPLRWLNEEEANDVQPHGHNYLMIQMAVLVSGVRNMETFETELHCRAMPSALKHASSIDFDVELLVEGKKHTSSRFRILDSWPASVTEETEDYEWPNPFPYPTITRVS